MAQTAHEMTQEHIHKCHRAPRLGATTHYLGASCRIAFITNGRPLQNTIQFMPWAVRRDRGAAANITLTRPDRLNAFTGEDILELKLLLEEISGDSTIRVVVLTVAGRAFCAGGDLYAMNMVSERPSLPDQALASMRNMVEVVELLHYIPKMTMAAVNGPCAGAGLSLAAACGMRHATCELLLARPSF
jgi:enoyl-CoA hydratase/carnithine racemase